jgi:heme/copper-type cytochrome/quinol oxidase subunit 2
MDQTTSIILLVGIIWAVGIIIAVIIIIAICCIRRGRERQSNKLDGPSEPSDKLIPPIFYTEHLRDPLAQEDLLERARANL